MLLIRIITLVLLLLVVLQLLLLNLILLLALQLNLYILVAENQSQLLIPWAQVCHLEQSLQIQLILTRPLLPLV